MVTIVNGNGPWVKNEGDRPGLYARFVQAAIAAIRVGSRSKVATIKAVTGTGSAEPGNVYRITRLRDAEELFGKDNVVDIKYAIIGGASEVVVATYENDDYATALNNLETYTFHVFYGPVNIEAGFATDLKTWLTEMKQVGKNFVAVVADNQVEGDVEGIKTNTTTFAEDETVVYVANGVIEADGTVLEPQEYAGYIAGLIAGTGLSDAITYKTVPFAEPSYRYRPIEIRELLKAGALVTTIDGDDVLIEQGLTLGKAPFNKIRTVRAKQAMLDDIDSTVKKSYIGRITNHEDGQIAVINGVKTYLQTLANNNVISPVFSVEKDPEYKSVGDELYLRVSVRFLDSIEYIYLTVAVRLTDTE